MIKKLFSISEPLALRLEQIAKDQKTTQSRIIETSLMVYLMMDKGNNTISKQLQELTSKNQKLILQEMDKIIKKD
jgi:predicted transcriptional regulator